MRFSSAQLSYAAGLKGYLDRSASLEFLKTMDIKHSVGHWSAGDFCDRFAPPGYHSDDPGFRNDFEGAVPAHQGGRHRRDRDSPERVREDAQRRPRSRRDRARAEGLSRRARHARDRVQHQHLDQSEVPARRPVQSRPALRKAALDEVLKGVEICTADEDSGAERVAGIGRRRLSLPDRLQAVDRVVHRGAGRGQQGMPRSTASSSRSSRSRTSRASSS